MLHFFPHYTEDAANTPLGAELRRLGLPHRFFGARISLRYRTVFGLLFSVYPRLAWFAMRSAVQSLLLSNPRPMAAIVGSDIEALVFGGLRSILRLPTLIVFETIIITPRRSQWMDRIHRRYYEFILSLVDLGICHSTAEVLNCTKAFAKTGCRFAFVPYGTTVNGRKAAIAAYANTDQQTGAIVAAGRSGRDYSTLVEAVRGLPCRLNVICDIGLPGLLAKPSNQITVIRDCFGQDYIEALSNAIFVVVPLAHDDISAGQMVLLQASALGKAVIITRTATSAEYATDGEDAVFVDMGDVGQMRAAIRHLLEDHAFRSQIGTNAALRFERVHSTEAYVRNLVAVVLAHAAEQGFARTNRASDRATRRG